MCTLLILAISFFGLGTGLVGCKADHASQASSEDQSRIVASAAGSAETPADPPAPDTAPRRNDSRPVIVCFGDSLTAGYGADAGQSYPDFLQKDLDAKGYQYRVVNDGVSGNTSKDGIDRMESVIALKPAVAIVEFGGNDGLRGFKVQTTHDNLARIIETLQSAGIHVVLAGITLPPDYGADYVNAFTANYPQLAKQYKVPLYPFLLKDVFGVAGMMQADKTHATAKGNEIVARNLLTVLLPELKK